MSISFVEQAPAASSAEGSLAELLVDPQGKEPIRGELFGQDRLEAHARQLAASCVLAPPRRENSPLLRRFEENGRILALAHDRIIGEGQPREGRGLDADWLADNYHIVEDVLREVRKDLPEGYDKELPKLAEGPGGGYPRVYALALAVVAHTDSEIDEGRLTRYVQAFQVAAPLTIGELWALPTMLRLVVVENLRRLAEQMLWGWDERARAEAWAARPAEAVGDDPGALPDLTDPFVVRLLQRLRDLGQSADVIERLEARLGGLGTDANEVLRREHRRQAANQISVGNCVTSLRLLSALDWNPFIERVSVVEAALLEDPAGVYSAQDFATRDRYRRAVEKIARRSGAEERDVARAAVELARDALAQGQGEARGHVGYYLIDRGQGVLKGKFSYKPLGHEAALDWILGHPRTTYFGSIAALFSVTLALLLVLAGSTARGFNAWALALLAVALVVPLSEVAVGLANHFLTLFLPPKVLPKLEFKEGIPAECATFVVMPSMLIRPRSAAALLERLEIHFLANPDPQLRFALLTDFADAPQEHAPEDEGYLRDALERVKALNERHARQGTDLFYLFHRKRLWNPVQGCWMGWERKRGKLSEFNRLLRGDRTTSYSVLSGDPATLPNVRYVITLDADTQMPRDTARRLVGTLAHPLNRARFDPALGKVVEGHGVLQPRVSFHLTAATHSRFAAILAASGGIDPYSSASSDSYMDLFGAGSFTGKGIYEVEAFEAATGHTFPENQILSHDLIEGNFARCGLVTDTELFDDFPARYHAYARREHRWVRGDWQLLPWLGRRVPAPPPEGSRPNPLPLLERWKLFDNLRRSLVPPALVALLALGWTALPGSPWLWTSVALAVPALPLLQVIGGTLVSCVKARSWAGLKRWRDSIPATGAQVLLAISFLADQARLSLDATVRTLYRLFVSRAHLLEWETAASTERRLGTGLGSFLGNMWQAPALALALALAVALVQPSALWAAGPVLAAWFLSPAVAYWVSRPRPGAEIPLSDADRAELRKVARRTWHFFETFVGDEDHWLPPDNFQEDPAPEGKVAHRTSPTNQGLLLLSTLAAHDLGYIATRTLLERLEKTFDTFDRMEKHWGHFYNWYNTKTLRPLPPLYVSTVDSGNLLGCLVALKRGLAEKAEVPAIGPEVADGLADTLNLAAEALLAMKTPARSEASETSRALEADFRKVRLLLETPPADLLAWDEWLATLDWTSTALVGRIRALAAEAPAVPERLEPWARRFSAQVQERRAELAALAPWLGPLRDFEAGRQGGGASEEAERRWQELRAALVEPASLSGIAGRSESLLARLAELAGDGPGSEGPRALAASVRESAAPQFVGRIRTLFDRAETLADGMEFRPLYKPDRNLYSIGCNLVQGRLDGACYDLLASEACLTSFLTIARGDAPRRHWFQLGRPYIRAAGRIGLVSWGGTMFEYLMPRLLMKSLPGTLVSDACRTAVARQIEYGKEAGIPWGISESAYHEHYVDGDYQYKAFGVPGLGLKRGLDQDLVIAPYATALATMIAPREALENFRRLAAEGGLGPYGYYEAVDYTRERVPKGKRAGVVRSYMAHHQGMSLVALANTVLDEPMPRRFHSEPMVRAVELLLQERIPRDATLVTPSESTAATAASAAARDAPQLLSRRLNTANTPLPRIQLLSNAQYHVMVTNSGAGYSSCRGLDVTRWREDATLDAYGQFCYVRDRASGFVWSAGYQPICGLADDYEVTFAADKAAFRRLDHGIETLLEITVSPEQLAEVRKVALTNRDAHPREIELTSYAEVVLLPRSADLAHPAFGKLFLETEWVPGSEALLCRRRPRSPEQRPVWAVHVSSVEGKSLGAVEYETDRARFLGRGRTTAAPEALDPEATLSGTTGAVLDPILSLRRRVRIEPGESAVISFATAVADSREAALALADQYRSPIAAARAFELAWAHSQVEHRHRNWSPEEAHLFQRLAAHIRFAGPALRAAPAAIAANRQGPSGLWRHSISGDLPIVLVRIAEATEVLLARQLLDAHTYLRLKGLEFDLVFANEEPTGYLETLNRQLLELIRASDAHDLVDKPGGVFVRKVEQLGEEGMLLLQAAARVVLFGDRGPLAGQLDRIERLATLPGAFVPSEAPRAWPVEDEAPGVELQFGNGLGGFSADGLEYRITVRPGLRQDIRRNGKPRVEVGPRPALPPAPWINVVANASFGFLVSEGGAGASWAGNSQTNRLTPWNNDPVSDPPAEILYLRDEATGEVWSPTPLPVPDDSTTTVRHGRGYTVFERRCFGIEHEWTLFVPPDDPVKVMILAVQNPGDRPRALSATFYADWVLGTSREIAAPQVVTEEDVETGALLARNAYRDDFAGRVAFADVDLRPRTLTADRGEFLGRNGSTAAPQALRRVELSGRVGAALDPCAAIQARFALAPGERKEVVFVLGEADTTEAVRALLGRYRGPGPARQALEASKAGWDAILSAVQVRTPDPGIDLLLNRWLIYQVLSCRLWGRTAFYQSGGAFGFRDQLQDVMALVYGAPGEARAHILRAASRQFPEGDVQHWWHPPAGRGIRTRISDDFLWLPFVVAHYVTTTGDASVLDETVTYLKAPPLKPEQEDDYGLPETSEVPGPLYEHCVRALEHGMRLGAHGLPLMGTGDWNDGMNRVGAKGLGESVWDAWFLMTTLLRFAPLAEARGDAARSARCLEQAEALRSAVEEHAWDGAWYRRAYFDDGTPLGSSVNDECRIDSIAQSWALISGAADPGRARKAFAALREHLVKADEGLILLLAPPFDDGPLEPGYIKGYLPGIRENGGQYTHAATWVVEAAALSGQGRLAVDLFGLLNPIRHADRPDSVARYKVEPYVVAGDVYSLPPHVGRGGWTWYSGSAAWLYRVALESILGFHLLGERLAFDPCLPGDWPRVEITYRHRSATYRIAIENPQGVERGVASLSLDGQPAAGNAIALADDGRDHDVLVILGGPVR